MAGLRPACGRWAVTVAHYRDRYSTVSARTDSAAVYVTPMMARGSCEVDLWWDHLQMPESCVVPSYVNGVGVPYP